MLEDAAQAHGALDPQAASVAAAYSFYPTKNLGGIGDGGAVVTDDADLAAQVRLLRAHGLTGDYVHTAVTGNSRLSEIEAAALRLELRRLPEWNARRQLIARAYREAAPELRWQAPHERHVYHLCVARIAGPRRVPSADAVRHRGPLPAGADPAARLPAFVRDAVPGGRGMGGRVRLATVLPRDDRRRDRDRVPRPPVNRAVESVSAFFPCYNDEATIGPWSRRPPRRWTGSAPTARSSSSTTARRDGSERVLKRPAETEPRLRVVTHERNRGYGGALLSGFGAATKQWVFYTDGDGQFDPTELELLVARATDDVDVVQGYKLSRADNVARRMIGRVYHRFVSFVFGLQVRDTDCDFRLMRRSMLEHVRLEQTTGVICVELVRTLQDAGARFVEVGVHHYPRVHGQSQFFRCRASPARCGTSPGSGCSVVLRRGKTRTADGANSRVATTTADVPTATSRRASQRRSAFANGAKTRSRERRSTSDPVSRPLGATSLEHGQQRRRRREKRVRISRPSHLQARPARRGRPARRAGSDAGRARSRRGRGAAIERRLEEQQRAPGAQDPRQLAAGPRLVAHVEQRDPHATSNAPSRTEVAPTLARTGVVADRRARTYPRASGAGRHRRPGRGSQPRAVPAGAAPGVEDPLVGPSHGYRSSAMSARVLRYHQWSSSAAAMRAYSSTSISR